MAGCRLCPLGDSAGATINGLLHGWYRDWSRYRWLARWPFSTTHTTNSDTDSAIASETGTARIYLELAVVHYRSGSGYGDRCMDCPAGATTSTGLSGLQP